DQNIVGFAIFKSQLYVATAQGKLLKKHLGVEVWAPTSFLNNGRKLTHLAGSEGTIAVADSSTIHILKDDGKWTKYPKGNIEINCLKVIRNQIWVGSSLSGLFVLDQGSPLLYKGLKDTPINDITSHKNDIIIGTNKGIFSVILGQGSPVPANKNLLSRYILCLASNNNILIAGTSTGGIYFSRNDAKDWEQLNTKNTGINSSLSVNAMTLIKNKLVCSLNEEGIYSSDDLGGSWNIHNRGLLAENVTSISKQRNSLLAGVKGKGVYVSNDEGNTYTLDGVKGTRQHPFYLARSNKTFFCATLEGVFFLTDLSTWENTGAPIGNSSVSYLTEEGNTLYACTEAGIFSRSNEGKWSLINSDLTDCNSLSARDGDLIVGSRNKGIFSISTSNWQAINASFPKNQPSSDYYNIRCVINSSLGKFAGTDGAGLYVKRGVKDWEPFKIASGVDTIFDLIEIDSNVCAATNKGIYVYNERMGSWRENSFQFNKAGRAISLFKDSTHLYVGFMGKSIYRINLKEVVRPKIDIKGKSATCKGDSIKLFASGFGPFTWRIGNLVQKNKDSLTLKLDSNLFVELIGKGDGMDTATIIPSPVEVCHPISFMADTTACPGDSLVIRVSAQGKVNWYSSGANNIPFNGNTFKTIFRDNITFVVEGEFGERDTLSIKRKAGDICFPVNMEGDTLSCIDQAITMKASGDLNYWWAWASQPADTISTDSIFTFKINEPRQLILNGRQGARKIKNISLKGDKDCFPLRIYELITPNSDGKNDSFYIENISRYQNKVSVFNKWGAEVFSAQNYDNTWNGNNLPGDFYYYIIEANEDKYKGSLLIKR
ncbi:MAG TPA: gliding motility-associated C-terminal domain-containing protein, partial [Cytophagaceae bacterium]